MPSHSVKQAKVMSAIVHGWHPTGEAARIPLKVAKEFHEADKGKKYGAHATGGIVIRPNPFLHRNWQFTRVPKLAVGGRPKLPFPQIRMPFGPVQPLPPLMKTHRPGFVRMEKGGFIASKVPGRTDKHYVTVKEGSYVLPADHISALGENNSIAGAEVVRKMFEHGQQFGPKLKIPKFAGGGAVDPVPIVVAGGEVILPPEIVKRIGKDNLERGHQMLDKWVLAVREKHIKKLESLKPPKGAKK